PTRKAMELLLTQAAAHLLAQPHGYQSDQYSLIGLSTNSFCCSSAVGAIFGMRSTNCPSSGMCDFMLGCGQSVPHSTRSGKVSTTRRANGTTSAYEGGPTRERRSGQLTFDQKLGCSRMSPMKRSNSGPSTGWLTSGRPM